MQQLSFLPQSTTSVALRTNASVRRDVVATQFIHHWPSFRQGVLNVLSGINLTHMVSSDSSEWDRYMIGNEWTGSFKLHNQQHLRPRNERAGCYAFIRPSFRWCSNCYNESVRSSRIVVLLSLSPSNVTVVEFKPFVGKPPKILSSVLPTNWMISGQLVSQATAYGGRFVHNGQICSEDCWEDLSIWWEGINKITLTK